MSRLAQHAREFNEVCDRLGLTPGMAARGFLLEWFDDRWHCNGRGIHAGDVLELEVGCLDHALRRREARWQRVRLESRDSGQVLLAFLSVGDGADFCRRVDTATDRFRWTDES